VPLLCRKNVGSRKGLQGWRLNCFDRLKCRERLQKAAASERLKRTSDWDEFAKVQLIVTSAWRLRVG
jgi:hypothetical protein